MTIKRIDGKETKQYTRLQYQNELVSTTKLALDRLGEVVIDIDANPNLPSVWIANVTGHLNPLTGSGGGFNSFIANGVTLDGLTSPVVEIAPANVDYCGTQRQTVGIEAILPTPTTNGRLEFRVTPTGVPIDNPFGANADFGMALPDFATLGDEVGADWVWDLSKNPLAGLQCFDLGLLP